VLELHGWGDLQSELNRLSKLGKWEEMGTLITDDVLNEFAVVGTPDEVIEGLRTRYPSVDRTVWSFEFLPPDQQREVLARLQA
jgi:alkanesulfonate monooxygenase SsuD/methylene tetrahydromethanopterin reductase-like flavin-dependent oxidoreductase (luciferase family)